MHSSTGTVAPVLQCCCTHIIPMIQGILTMFE